MISVSSAGDFSPFDPGAVVLFCFFFCLLFNSEFGNKQTLDWFYQKGVIGNGCEAKTWPVVYLSLNYSGSRGRFIEKQQSDTGWTRIFFSLSRGKVKWNGQMRTEKFFDGLIGFATTKRDRPWDPQTINWLKSTQSELRDNEPLPISLRRT